MKTRFLLVFMAMMLPLLVNAQTYYDIEVNGIYYKLNNETKEATVVANTGYKDGFGGGWSILNTRYSGNLVIPETFTSNGQTYTVTKIDGQVRNLDYYESLGAFEGCTGLTSITIPKSIKNIGHDAFSGCTSLNAVYISDMTVWCNIIFDLHDRYLNYCPAANPLYYAHSLYLNGILISDLVIPYDLTKIGTGSFIGSNIKSVTIPKSVNTINSYAFDACDNLNDVYIYSKGISSIDDISSFKDVGNLTLHIRERYKTNFIDSEDDSFNGVSIWEKFGKVEYIEGVDFHLIYKVDDKEYKNIWYEEGESIAPEAEPTKEGYSFSGWSEIPETMPDHDFTVTGTFSPNTYKLAYIVDGEEYKVVEVKCDAAITAEACPTKKGMTFSGWSDIPETMPAKDVTVTGSFSWSKNTVDNVIYEVSDTINNYCKAIGNESASGAIKIAEAVDFDFSYNVTTITDNAFNGCKDITSIEIPATVTTIGERAFASIDKLTDVTIYAEEVPETDRTAFENSYIEDYVALHVPAASIDKYKEVAPWKNFKSIVAIDGTEEDDNTEEGDDVVNPEEGDTDETNVGEDVIPVSGAKQTTWCSAYDLDFTGVEGVKAYIASGYDRETGIIWLTRVNKVPAGEGILIIADKGDYTIPHVSTSAYYANLMVGTLKAMVLNETDGEYTNYYLSNGTSGVGFYKVNGSVDIKANRAYLPLLKGTTKANTRFIGIGFEDEDGTTGIEVQSSIFNLQSKDVYYNLQGQRVDNPAKGIYIRNGKKVIVR